ncbi:MAG TPA: L-histidine N(alpha)-methyltransferase, partial [Polyangiaceae bacterium]
MSQRLSDLPITKVDAFESDVLAGLGRHPKSLPCKYFYDAAGAELFDRICELEVYYPTRTELAIMRSHVREMAKLIGGRARLVELGSGSSSKTRILLDHLVDLEAYVPVDISPEYLARAAKGLARDYPGLNVAPVRADYSRPFELPKTERTTRTIVYFPGSTIGNFQPAEAKQFLKVIAALCRKNGALLIGVDLKKDARVLDAAYDDPEGVTAAFNLNLLVRINRELEGNFDLQRFRHRAFYDAAHGRIEMQLVSSSCQTVTVAGSKFPFEAGEAITTEYSYKYELREFAQLALSAGLVVQRLWTDEKQLFSVQYCTPA